MSDTFTVSTSAGPGDGAIGAVPDPNHPGQYIQTLQAVPAGTPGSVPEAASPTGYGLAIASTGSGGDPSAAATAAQQAATAAQTAQDQMNALQAVQAAFPWLGQMGITDQLQSWIVQGYTDPMALVGLIRQTPQYAAMFPGIRRPDGTMRADEATYLSTDDQYRSMLKNNGLPGQDYSTAASLQAFWENNITPQEMSQRLDTYDKIVNGSTDVKAAFYVYGGLNVSNDDLYQATVDPAYRAQLQTAYAQAVTTSPPDNATFIQRATEFSLNNISAMVANLGATGRQAAGQAGALPTSQADMGSWMAKFHAIDPADATALMTQLQQTTQQATAAATGADGATSDPANPTPYLTLEQLTFAFQEALIGGAATTQGLTMPSLEQAQRFVQAGVDRATALKDFGDIAVNQNYWSGAAQRAGRGPLSQADLENALLANDAPSAFALQQGEQSEAAMGQAGGGVTVNPGNVPGQLKQEGFQGRY